MNSINIVFSNCFQTRYKFHFFTSDDKLVGKVTISARFTKIHLPMISEQVIFLTKKCFKESMSVWKSKSRSNVLAAKFLNSCIVSSWRLYPFCFQSFLSFLSDKISSYKSKATIDINHDQLHSALAICYLVDQHAMPISDAQLNGLWDGLMLSPCSEDMCVTVLQSIRRQFGKYLK